MHHNVCRIPCLVWLPTCLRRAEYRTVMTEAGEAPVSAFPPLPEEEAARLCANWAESSRINLSEEHSQLVTGIAGMEEQLQSFSELLHCVQTAKSVQMASLSVFY